MATAGAAVALAVSGGGDSVALMHLAARHAARQGLPAPVVLTVDHRLRKGSAADAKKVAAWAKALGLETHILTWTGSKPRTGIEAAARQARYRLMGRWMKANRVPILYVGHTQDDQAETFLLRLARGSGVDGLSAMAPRAPWPVPGFAGLSVHRPLLGLSRAELRAHLAAIGQDWLEDPMNLDPAFDRVRLRAAADALTAAGLTAGRIAAAAAHLARARAALEQVTQAVLARAVRPVSEGVPPEGLLLDATALAAAPREVGLRALAAVLMAVSGAAYRPRFDALERLFDRIVAGELGGGATLAGCRVAPARRGLRGSGSGVLLVRREGPRKVPGSKTGA